MSAKIRARKTRQRKVQVSDSFTAIAYAAIKEEILTNRLRSGAPLPLERFVEELGLSRTPLREAILRLEKEGLVEVRPRMGTFVSHLDLREIQEMYEVRRELEGLAARLAAARVRPEQLAVVERELTALSLNGRGKVDYQALSEAGQALHRLIVESCGNQVLARFIRSLQDHFTRFRSLSLNIPEKIRSSHREHLQILKALKQGDGAKAEKLIHEHFDHAGRFLLESLIKQSRRGNEMRITVPLDR
jgi:GntR family transcriptional regulator, rspAB operon transcriptional repressor